MIDTIQPHELDHKVAAENRFFSSLLKLAPASALYGQQEEAGDEVVADQKPAKSAKQKGGRVSLQELQERLRQKLEERKQTQGEGVSQADKKRKREEDTTPQDKKHKQTNKRMKTGEGSRKGADKGRQEESASEGEEEPQQSKKSKTPVVEEDIQFSKFDFTVDKKNKIEEDKKNTKSKDLKKALQKVERFEQRLEKVEDPSKKQHLLMKRALAVALDKAEGNKVKDNAKLIKKSLKKQEQKKKKSAQQWNDRKKAETDAQKEKAQKRQENIEERKRTGTNAKKDKEEKGDKKEKEQGGKDKGNKKARPGFEGKRDKFLNSK